MLAVSLLFGGAAGLNTIVRHGRHDAYRALSSADSTSSGTTAAEQDGFGHRGPSSTTARIYPSQHVAQ